jgi:hypothetical protein
MTERTKKGIARWLLERNAAMALIADDSVYCPDTSATPFIRGFGEKHLSLKYFWRALLAPGIGSAFGAVSPGIIIH